MRQQRKGSFGVATVRSKREDKPKIIIRKKKKAKKLRSYVSVVFLRKLLDTEAGA